MREPIKLSETDQLPAALRDAFGALARDAPSPETVLRVQRALEALPAATPAAAVVGGFGASKLLVLLTLIAGAVTTALVVKGSRQVRPHPVVAERVVEAASTPHALEQSAHQAEKQVPLAGTVAPAPEPPTAKQAATTQGVRETAQARSGRETRQASASERTPAHSALRTARIVRTPSAELSPDWAQGLIAPAASGASSASRTESATAARAAGTVSPASAASETAQPTAPAPPAPDPRLAAAQASEAQKLAQCKRLAAQDPARALRQLEALAREAPNGAFVPERELLEIRLHERLGHAARAAELTRRFLERHPNSVYRRAQSP